MSEEVKQQQEEYVPTPEEVLIEMKQNTVSKSDYDQVVNKYNDLFRRIANGEMTNEQEQPSVSEEELTKHFEDTIRRFKSRQISGTLDSIEGLLEVDDYCLRHGQRSCFLPTIGEITDELQNSRDNTRAMLEYVRDNADGDDELASSLLSKSLVDTRIIGR